MADSRPDSSDRATSSPAETKATGLIAVPRVFRVLVASHELFCRAACAACVEDAAIAAAPGEFPAPRVLLHGPPCLHSNRHVHRPSAGLTVDTQLASSAEAVTGCCQANDFSGVFLDVSMLGSYDAFMAAKAVRMLRPGRSCPRFATRRLGI